MRKRLYSALPLNKLVLKSYAKLNLYLAVLGKRKDNYHKLNTLFERIGLSDTIVLKPRRDDLIKITCENKDVPTDESNLCYQAAKLFRQKCGIRKGVDIKIEKNIPVGAGLGGGSGNAATVLMGLKGIWKARLSRKALCSLAEKLGSDVSFFLYDVPFAQGTGRGEKIRPLAGLKSLKLWHILIVPKLHIPTSFIYKKWDELAQKNKKAALTRKPCNVKIITSILRQNNFADLNNRLFNDLERVTLPLYAQVKRVREALKRSGIGAVLMSGSGPAVFGIVTSKKEAVALKRKLSACNSSWSIFVTRTR